MGVYRVCYVIWWAFAGLMVRKYTVKEASADFTLYLGFSIREVVGNNCDRNFSCRKDRSFTATPELRLLLSYTMNRRQSSICHPQLAVSISTNGTNLALGTSWRG